MKRKFLSTLLFGALACTTLSTVTSCKDYDDDINNLQEQIDKKAALDKVNDLITQVSNVETQAKSAYDLAASKASKEDVEAAKTAATEAAKKAAQEIADAANTKADAAAAAAKAAQETADQAVKDAAAANKAAEDVAGKLKDYVLASELKTQLENLKTELEQGSIKELTDKVKGYDNAINALYSAVTEVSLVGTLNKENLFASKFDLTFETGVEAPVNQKNEAIDNFTFGVKEIDDLKGEHSATPADKTYKKGQTINFPTDLLVRINPVNANLDKDMVKLVNSKGEDLSEVVNIVGIEPYEELLTKTRATSKGGLWRIKLQLADGVKPNKEGYIDATSTKVDNKAVNIRYAVAVNNTAAQAETNASAADRYVVSTYDVTVGKTKEYTAAKDLAKVMVYAESKTPTKDTEKTAAQISNIKQRKTDNTTNGLQPVAVANGENIVVDFSNAGVQDLDRFYVVLDTEHAGTDKESQDSEIKAWESYTIDGTNKIVAVEKGTGKAKVTVTIPGTIKDGDEVAFRIFAVNYKGVVVPTNGQSFVAYVGNKATTATTVGNVVATKVTGSTTDILPISGALKAGNNLPTSKFDLTVGDVKVNVTPSYFEDAKGEKTTVDPSKAKYIQFTVNTPMNQWPDGTEATGVIETTKNQLVENSISVSLTKVLPNAEYAKAHEMKDYTWKDKQLVDGVYTAYLTPVNSNTAGFAYSWTTASDWGYKDMNQAITDLPADAYISFANAAIATGADGKNYFTGTKTVKGSSLGLFVWNKADDATSKLIDGTTKHATEIGYNYGKVSSKKVNNQLVDYTVAVENVQTIFACPLAKPIQNFAWEKVQTAKKGVGGATADAYSDVNVLVYNNDETVKGLDGKNVEILDYLKASNSYNPNDFGSKKAFSAMFADWYVGAPTAKLISNGSKKEDYFKVSIEGGKLKIETQSNATPPTADVPSTLVITVHDAFGHEMVYDLPFTVKRQ